MTAATAHPRGGHPVHVEAALRHLIRAAEDFIQGDGSRVEVDLDYCAALADLERAVDRAREVWARHRRGVLRPRGRRREGAARTPGAPRSPDAGQHPLTAAGDRRPDTAARHPHDTHVTTPAGPAAPVPHTRGEQHG